MSYIHLIVSFIVVRECVRRLTHKLPERSLVRVTFPFEGDRPRVIRGLPALVQKKKKKAKPKNNRALVAGALGALSAQLNSRTANPHKHKTRRATAADKGGIMNENFAFKFK